MDTTEINTTMSDYEQIPHSANSLKFAASRSVEIAAMTESILRPSKTKLIFQNLPVHMRRRVMSHNCKRLPRNFRLGHLEQLNKSGFPPKQKRPSRKYRRRPANLLEEYNRRQRRIIWLETHIWHAKRFHMIQRWNHRLAYAPCDKAFRACYRATSAHCLIQDISYYAPIQITGPFDYIKHMFTYITSPSCGLGMCAKAYTTGNREGVIHMFRNNSFPFGYIGKIYFVWIAGDNSNKTLWLFVHPSQVTQIESVLTELSSQLTDDYETEPKKRKLANDYTDNMQVKVLHGAFNRFRLTGPNSHEILVRTLKTIDDIERIKTNDWISQVTKNNIQLYLKEKHEYWQSISSLTSPSQLPPRVVIGLTVKDPRLSRPLKRTKAQRETTKQINITLLINIPHKVSNSPLWDTDLHKIIKCKMMTNGQFIEHITNTQMVPGELYEHDPALQSVPVILIQRPGSQNSKFKKLGYGSGWDIIVPSGYALPFWYTFIMFGARAGGLRETESLAFEMGECYLPPDSEAGKEEEKRIEIELRDKYFKLPPSKRVNFVKLAVNTPFICPWKILLKDWSNTNVDDFFILRDKMILDQIQDCIKKKTYLPQIEKSESCLIAVYIQIEGKGNLKRHAHICLPELDDVDNMKSLFEPHHKDPNEKLRRQNRLQHRKDIKQLRRKRMQLKKSGVKVTMQAAPKNKKHHISEYVKTMRELWLPSTINSVRCSSNRQILGYLSQGAFSFSEAQSCGVGYVAYMGLNVLLNSGQNKVLVRNTSSRKYRLANFQIIIP